MWSEIQKIIDQKNHFLITTHVNPDGDGIGAACALIELLKSMGKKVRFVCDSPIPQRFKFLDFYHSYERYAHEKTYDDVEVVIMVDTHQKERIGDLANLTTHPNIKTICIDHHLPIETFTPYLAIDPNACSSGALVYSLCKAYGFDLNHKAAMGLYVSVICDTGRFCYSSTDLKAHQIAEECIMKGVDPDWMYSHIYQQVTISEFMVFARALQHMELHCDNRVVVQQIRKEDYELFGKDIEEILQSDFEYFHEINKVIMGIECVVLLREMPDNEIRISLRSKTDLPVDLVTRSFGGGGHPRAAGATVKGDLNAIKLLVVNLIEDQLLKKKGHKFALQH